MNSTLIVGCGFLGRRVGRLLAARGQRVWGTVRSQARAAELPAWGVDPIVANVLDADSLVRLPLSGRVVYCVGFDRTAGIPMRTVYVDGLRHALGRLVGQVKLLVYASSTGVYARDDGGWVDEDYPAEPRHEAGRVCLEGEEVVREYARERGLQAIILRFSGLYGPGRVMRKASLAQGDPIVGDPAKWLNVIHVDDAAAATVAALDQGRPGRTYVVSDDRPVERREFYGRVSEQLGYPPPRFVLPEPGSPEAAREESNKRAANRRMREELGVELTYPDITTGIPAALAGEPRPAAPG